MSEDPPVTPPTGDDPPVTPPTDPPVTPPAGGFADGFDADLKSAVETKGWKGPEEVARSYFELEKKVGAKGVVIPKDDAPTDEFDRFYNELGRPESADKYDVGDWKPPEGLPWNADAQKEMSAELHKLGLSNKQHAGALEAYGRTQHKFLSGATEETEKQRKADWDTLDREWGDAKDAKMDNAKLAARTFFDTAVLDQIEAKTGTAGLMRAMEKIGSALGEEGLLDGDSENFTMSPAEATAEIAKLEGDTDFQAAFLDKQNPENEAAVRRMQRLQKMAKGGQQ